MSRTALQPATDAPRDHSGLPARPFSGRALTRTAIHHASAFELWAGNAFAQGIPTPPVPDAGSLRRACQNDRNPPPRQDRTL
jgi:hypothetical protein